MTNAINRSSAVSVLLLILGSAALPGCGGSSPSQAGTAPEHETNIVQLRKAIADKDKEIVQLRKAIADKDKEIVELKREVQRGVNRLTLLGLLVSAPLAVLGIIGIVSFLKSGKTTVVAGSPAECPSCGWDLPPGTTVCPNPDCKLRMK